MRHKRPPRGEETGLRQKDDGGMVNDVDLNGVRHQPRHYRLLTPNPPGRRGNGTPPKGRWGYGQRCRPQWCSTSAETLSPSDSQPPRGEETGLRQKDDGGGQRCRPQWIDTSKNYRCSSYTPPRRGNGTPPKGRWGSIKSMPINEIASREKLSLQAPIPPINAYSERNCSPLYKCSLCSLCDGLVHHCGANVPSMSSSRSTRPGSIVW